MRWINTISRVGVGRETVLAGNGNRIGRGRSAHEEGPPLPGEGLHIGSLSLSNRPSGKRNTHIFQKKGKMNTGTATLLAPLGTRDRRLPLRCRMQLATSVPASGGVDLEFGWGLGFWLRGCEVRRVLICYSNSVIHV